MEKHFHSIDARVRPAVKHYPFVSIIVAAYNAERTLLRCIRSLQQQDYPNYNIVVIDNNSTDATPAIVQSLGVDFLCETRKGWPAARNKGIFKTEAEYVANIDADCFATSTWLTDLFYGFRGEKTGCVVGKTLVEEGITLAQK